MDFEVSIDSAKAFLYAVPVMLLIRAPQGRQEFRNRLLDGLGERGSGTLPQHRGQRIAILSWMRQLDNILLKRAWRSLSREVKARTPQ